MARDSWLKRLIWLRGSPAGGSGASYEKTVGPAPIISISDAKAKPAKSLIVGMEPIQDLHGYDSPWPAGGGKNLLNTSDFTAGTTAFGLTSAISGEYISFSGTCSLGGTHTWVFATVDSAQRSTASGCSFAGFIISGGSGLSISSIAYSSDNYKLSITLSGLVTSQVYHFNIGIVAYTGTAPTAWSPYFNLCPITGWTEANIYRYAEYDADAQPTYTIQLGQTVYGGTVDVVSGLLTVTHKSVNLGSLSWAKELNPNLFRTTLNDMLFRSLPICSMYKGVVVTGASSIHNMECASTNSQVVNLFRIRDDNAYALYDATGFQNYVSGQTLAYKLATPQTYQLTPQQIQLLKGSNTLWSDADDLTLTYIGTTPANLLGGMLGGGLGGGYNPPAEQDPEELTEPEATETDEPADETPAEEGENNGE